jgi:hypothetical protein
MSGYTYTGEPYEERLETVTRPGLSALIGKRVKIWWRGQQVPGPPVLVCDVDRQAGFLRIERAGGAKGWVPLGQAEEIEEVTE